MCRLTEERYWSVFLKDFGGSNVLHMVVSRQLQMAEQQTQSEDDDDDEIGEE